MNRLLVAALAFAAAQISATAACKLEVRPTPSGPRLHVNGEPALPRFYYGSPTCLCNLSRPHKATLKIPFEAPVDTERGRVALNGYYGVDPFWFSDVKLVDLTTGASTVILAPGSEIHARDYVADNLHLVANHRYHFVITHRAKRPRTYFHISVTYADGEGRDVKIPYYYGDTLGDTVRLAAREAGVNLVTFSTDSSWGSEGWWNPPEAGEDYSKLDQTFRRLIAINPKVLLVPRIMTDAPVWMLKRHPEIKMAFDTGFELGMSSVSARRYREAACAEVEKLARHLKREFPDNFAGLQISGQNSAEWFYMMSQSEHLSGYDAGTREAFRAWLKGRGAADWATAEVPSSAARHQRHKDARLLEFTKFRQREMTSFLVDLAAAAKRGSNGEALNLFFYGYSWEVGGVPAGAGETGHFDFGWLMANAHGKIDGFSSPLSYTSRNLTGSTVMMSAAETVLNNGYLWFNEIDHRTHREEMWDHMGLFTPYKDPSVTREIMLRDSAADILRGYGDWWMDLFGRGWFRDAEIWRLRAALNELDRKMLARARRFEPEIANVVDEGSFLHDGWGAGRWGVLDRRGFATCGANYGQYLLADFLRHPPPSVKLVYLTVADHLDDATRERIAAFRREHPGVKVVENVKPADLAAAAIAARAKAAGVHLYAPPGKANVTAAEGYVLVQALSDGPLTIDFGRNGAVRDVLKDGCAQIGSGSVHTLSFRAGETKLLAID